MGRVAFCSQDTFSIQWCRLARFGPHMGTRETSVARFDGFDKLDKQQMLPISGSNYDTRYVGPI